MRRSPLPAIALCLFLVLSACGGSAPSPGAVDTGLPTGGSGVPSGAAPATGTALAGMPPVLDPADIYAADRPGALSPAVAGFPSLIYVPNSDSNTVDVIDPFLMKVVDHFQVGKQPQHVVPSWDLQTLYATNDMSNTLTPIDPKTGKPGPDIPVDDPYNMYFTPDGRYAIVVAERLGRLDFRDASTMALHRALPVPCPGVDHMDFSADGSYLLASCEFGGSMVKVDVATEKVVGTLLLPRVSKKVLAKPQDVKLSPDGTVFYVADMTANGVWEIDGETMSILGFLHTGSQAHGLYVSRDSKVLFVSNRGEGSISVVDFSTRSVAATWRLPGGGSPDMGGVSTDGRVLWLSGRYNKEVYAIDTTNGQLVGRIKVGPGPHGLCVFPQPGRYSLGHTGILR